MGDKYNFIVIDDSALDCFIAEKMIRHTDRSNEVKSFTSASAALEFITGADNNDKFLTIIILDVLMPLMNGFEFVEAFEKLPANKQQCYYIVALTSSMNKNDMEKISGYQTVKHLLDKPITSETILPLLK